ncbi:MULTISPECIES: hypothetical protein [Brevundimonas]|uniref:hypothetical protein n=1 Tax=Brevundimonas sp. UBA7507 TaxID=1946137 RepID=UPI00257C15AE|nr:MULTISPECIES: hypothetical protein [Brevundimonas]
MSADKDRPLPALFATIHFRSARRPDGYTADEIAHLNRAANRRKPDEDADDGEDHDQPKDR